MNLDLLLEQVETVSYLIGLAILLIEIAEMLFKGEFRGKTLGEMLVSFSTQIPYVIVNTLFLTGAYSIYWIIHYEISWSIPVTWWSLALVLLIADVTYYWEHRIAHEVRLLWTQHAVHHSSREFNIATAFRFGPLEGAWSLVAHIPMALMGFAPEAIEPVQGLVLNLQFV